MLGLYVSIIRSPASEVPLAKHASIAINSLLESEDLQGDAIRSRSPAS